MQFIEFHLGFPYDVLPWVQILHGQLEGDDWFEGIEHIYQESSVEPSAVLKCGVTNCPRTKWRILLWLL